MSIFDSITEDDLIMAFFPCIYFCEKSQVAMSWCCVNYRKLSTKQASDKIIERSKQREVFFELAVMMLTIAKEKGVRLIMENPWSNIGYLRNNFVMQPSLIDKNRQKRGDYFKKPTAYWFINCEPTHGHSYISPKEHKTIALSKPSSRAGICSEERSMISPDYAKAFIHDFIFGTPLYTRQLELFN